MNIEKKIKQIIKKHNCDDEITKLLTLSGGEIYMLLPRLERAAMNQADNGRSTVSRYGIWASTVNSFLNEAQQQIVAEKPEEAIKMIKKIMGSMSAFEEIQALFDPWQNREG